MSGSFVLGVRIWLLDIRLLLYLVWRDLRVVNDCNEVSESNSCAVGVRQGHLTQKRLQIIPTRRGVASVDNDGKNTQGEDNARVFQINIRIPTLAH